MTHVIQGVKSFFCFDLILFTEKQSSYNESIIIKKLMYASLAFLECVTLLQFLHAILTLRLYKFIHSIFLYSNMLLTKETWKMIVNVSFYNPTFKCSIHDLLCDDMINRADNLYSNTS